MSAMMIISYQKKESFLRDDDRLGQSLAAQRWNGANRWLLASATNVTVTGN